MDSLKWRRICNRAKGSPFLGRCYRCARSWAVGTYRVTPHRWADHIPPEDRTDNNNSGGMFPLCNTCWAELSPEGRLPFYRHMYEKWIAGGVDPSDPDYRWEDIEWAVLHGF